MSVGASFHWVILVETSPVAARLPEPTAAPVVTVASPEVAEVALPVTVELESLLATAPVVLELPEIEESVVEVELLALPELAKPLSVPVGDVLLAFAVPEAVASVLVACEDVLLAARASLLEVLVVDVAFEVAPEVESVLATALEASLVPVVGEVVELVLDASPVLANPLLEPVWLLVVSEDDEDGAADAEPERLELSLLAIELLLASVVEEVVALPAEVLPVLAKPLLLSVELVVSDPEDDGEDDAALEVLAESLLATELIELLLESVVDDVVALPAEVLPVLANPLLLPVALVVSVEEEDGEDELAPETLDESLLAIALLSADELLLASVVEEIEDEDEDGLLELAKPLFAPVADVVSVAATEPLAEAEPLRDPLAEALWLWSMLLLYEPLVVGAVDAEPVAVL